MVRCCTHVLWLANPVLIFCLSGLPFKSDAWLRLCTGQVSFFLTQNILLTNQLVR